MNEAGATGLAAPAQLVLLDSLFLFFCGSGFRPIGRGIVGGIRLRLIAHDGDNFVALVEVDELDTLGVPTHNANLGRADANDLPVESGHHDLVVVFHFFDRDHVSRLLIDFDAKDALAATALCFPLSNGRSLAIAVFGHEQNLIFGIAGLECDEPDYFVAFV